MNLPADPHFMDEGIQIRLREAVMRQNPLPERSSIRKLRLLLEGIVAARGWQKSLLLVLSARGLPVTAQERARFKECTDVAQLSAWMHQAATADSVAEVLAAKPRPKNAAPPARRASPKADHRAAR